VVRTALLDRLQEWSRDLVHGKPGTPSSILLIGGPGNGKTEAVEALILEIDKELNANGSLVKQFQALFSPPDGSAVPRRAEIQVSGGPRPKNVATIVLVQDASVADPALPGKTAAALLASDLTSYVLDRPGVTYIACVNRGVLDDALIHAISAGGTPLRKLLEAITTAVSLTPNSPSCWPLFDFPNLAVWPMDVESLLQGGDAAALTAGHQLLDVATAAESWPAPGACAAGDKCPFCTSRSLLEADSIKLALLSILRLYELGSGKRWSFRDLHSLFSFMLAGAPTAREGDSRTPCEWAAHLLHIEAVPSSKSESLRARVPFILVAAQYQHALFGQWPRGIARKFRADLRELRLESQQTLLGLYYFLASARGHGVPATLAPQLSSMCESLDPALASPDEEIAISSRTTIALRELDRRFSHSVTEGLQFIRKYHCLTSLEVDLLQRLALADELLSEGDVQRRRPATAARIQRLIRDFASRLTRRSLGVRAGMVKDYASLNQFRRVIEGDEQLLHEAVKQVEGLLNDRDRFVVTLNTTFGESLPPEPRRAVLLTDKQKVRPREHTAVGRPLSALRFLSVGDGPTAQAIPLTYELFRSVRELKGGMLPASLPRTVVALLDTTRARLSGRIVRRERLLEGAEIRIGLTNEVVVRELGKFIIRREDGL
jgi:hypothetical protein